MVLGEKHGTNYLPCTIKIPSCHDYRKMDRLVFFTFLSKIDTIILQYFFYSTDSIESTILILVIFRKGIDVATRQATTANTVACIIEIIGTETH